MNFRKYGQNADKSVITQNYFRISEGILSFLYESIFISTFYIFCSGMGNYN